MAEPRIVARIDTQAILGLGRPGGSVYRHMAALGARVETRAKRNASGRIVKVRTGNLRSSITTETHTDGARVVTTVTADAPYAYAVHEGTRPHEIRPVQARVLAWHGPDGPRFARRVQHPGTQPRPFLSDGLEEVRA